MAEFSYLSEVIFCALRELGGTHRQDCLSQLLEESPVAVRAALQDLCNRGVLIAYENGERRRYGVSEKYTKIVNANIIAAEEHDIFTNISFPGTPQKVSACFYLKEQGKIIEACTVLFSCLDRFLENSHSFSAVACLDLGIRYLQQWAAKPENPNDTLLFLELVLCAGDTAMYLTKHLTPMLELAASSKNIALNAGEFPAATLLGIVEACLENMRAECSAARLHQVRQNWDQFLKEFNSTEYASFSQHFSGMFYFWEGNFHKVLQSFENTTNQIYGSLNIWKGRFQSEMYPLYTSSSALYLNRFHQAVGILEAARRSASLHNHKFKTMWWEAQLAMVLLYMNQCEEALELINNVIIEVDPKTETKIYFWVMRGLAYYHWRKGRIKSAHKILSEAFSISQKNAMKRPIYSYPWMLDMLYSFLSMGMTPIPGVSFDEELSRALEGPNKHLQASALRTVATLFFERNAGINEALQFLQQSEDLFRRIGNQLESARTGLRIAICLDAMNAHDESENIRSESLKILSNFGQLDLYPTDCMKINDNKLSQEMHGYVSFLQDLPQTQFYLENSQKNLFKIPIQNILTKKIITDSILSFSEYDPLENCRIAFESLPSLSNLNQFLSQVAYIACSELGAERALIAQMNEDGGLDIKATSNISSKEIETGTLIPKLSSILSKLENTPLFIEENGVVSLTMPLKINNLNFWILYIESSYAIHALKSINPKCYKEIVWIFSQEIRHALHYAEKNIIDNTPLFSSISIFRKDRLDSIVYESKIMRKLISKTRHVSTTEAPILILGETGVGKELLAQYIHNCSGRHGNFIAVHPASNAENLFESEFFGHEKGAFTSAHKKRIGLVELAHNGTLFIDEVGDIPLAIQTKLLRVFQDRCFWRVGGNNPIESNFRLVGATNKDLWEEVLAGRFRKDLYYRMAVIPLTLPPLRDRKEDIPVLAKLFLSKFSKFYNKNISYSDEIIFDKLLKYDWPGNVRELKSVIERAVILYHGNELKFEIQSKNTDYNNCEKFIQNNDDFTSDLPTLDILEERYIKHVLNITDGKITGKKGALDILGMKRSTFYSKIKNWS